MYRNCGIGDLCACGDEHLLAVALKISALVAVSDGVAISDDSSSAKGQSGFSASNRSTFITLPKT
jgi:hypothetical protein